LLWGWQVDYLGRRHHIKAVLRWRATHERSVSLIFETERDRGNQDRLQFVLEHKGFRVEQTSTLCSWDMRLYWGVDLNAIVECKFRDRLWNPLKIDVTKVDSLCHGAKELGVRPLLIIGTPNSPYYQVEARMDWLKDVMLRKRGGVRRKETEDAVYCIPRKEFTLIE
jgi:hypothetical protein